MSGRSSLVASVLTDRAGVARFCPDWQAFLAERPAGANLRNEPIRIGLVLDASPAVCPRIVTLRDRDRLVAIAPFYVETTGQQMALGARKLASLSMRVLSLFGDEILLARQADAQECFEAIFGAVTAMPFDLGTIHAVDRDQALGRYLTSCRFSELSVLCQSPERIHEILLRGSYGDYLASLGSKTRQNLRRLTRRLLEQDEIRIVRITDADQIDLFLAALDKVWERSWQKGAFGYQRRNTDSGRTYYRVLAEQGWLRAYVMYAADTPIAFELGFQYGERFYGHECGYDPDWADRSPGAVLIFHVIEDLFRNRTPDVLDFGFGDHPYKKSLSTSSRIAGHVQLARTLRGRMALRSQRWLDRIAKSTRSGNRR